MEPLIFSRFPCRPAYVVLYHDYRTKDEKMTGIILQINWIMQMALYGTKRNGYVKETNKKE